MNNYATKPDLKTKRPVGGNGVAAPEYKEGETVIIATKSADMTNSSTNINQTASGENLSAKFKNPNVKQSVPEAGQGQYMPTE